MAFQIAVLAFCLISLASGAEYTTPVPILKQIDRHNDDGSYSYGYEGADGSFKIETKYPTGEVYGKYGYVDDTGKVREVEYGANKFGFQPAGNDINVAPPTLDPKGNNALADGSVDDGQYREDPSVYHKDPRYNNNQIQPSRKQQQSSNSFFESSWGTQQNQPQNNGFSWEFENHPSSKWNTQPVPKPAPIWNPAPQPAPVWNPPPQPAPVWNPPAQQTPVWNTPTSSYWNYNSWDNNNNNNNEWNNWGQPQRYYNPQPQQNYYNPSQFITHPAVKNIDYLSGSYSVSYGRK